jgi:hypothetical protein
MIGKTVKYYAHGWEREIREAKILDKILVPSKPVVKREASGKGGTLEGEAIVSVHRYLVTNKSNEIFAIDPLWIVSIIEP